MFWGACYINSSWYKQLETSVSNFCTQLLVHGKYWVIWNTQSCQSQARIALTVCKYDVHLCSMYGNQFCIQSSFKPHPHHGHMASCHWESVMCALKHARIGFREPMTMKATHEHLYMLCVERCHWLIYFSMIITCTVKLWLTAVSYTEVAHMHYLFPLCRLQSKWNVHIVWEFITMCIIHTHSDC